MPTQPSRKYLVEKNANHSQLQITEQRIKRLTVLMSHSTASGNNLGLRGTDRGEIYCALHFQERSWQQLSKTLFKFAEQISAK